MVAGGFVKSFVGFAAAAGEGFFGRALGDQAVAAGADQILAAGLFQGLADFEIVFGFEELQQGALQAAVAEVFGDVDRLHRERVVARVVHAGGDVEGAGDEILHLVGAVVVALEEQGQVDHRVQVAAWMAGDVVRDEVLLFAGGFRLLVERAGEFFEVVVARFFHLVQHAGVGVFGGDFQMAADVVLGQFAHVDRIAAGQVHADAGGDQHFAHAGELARFFHQVDQRAVVGAQQFADGGMDATEAAADGFDFGAASSASGTCWRWGRRYR